MTLPPSRQQHLITKNSNGKSGLEAQKSASKLGEFPLAQLGQPFTIGSYPQFVRSIQNLCEFERVNLTTIALPGTKETHKSPARPAATTRVQRVLL